MEFKILRAAVSEERRQWQDAWRLFPANRRDVYFQPGYLLPFESKGESEACCALAIDGGRVGLYPFLKLIIELPPSVVGAPRFDVQTPYGYGGPIVNEDGEAPDFLAEMGSRWSAWCADSGVVSEFVRFHPLLDNRRWAHPEMVVALNRQTIPIPLDIYPTRLKDDSYFRRHRQMLNKAQREGYSFERMEVAGQIGWFASMYSDTQDRLHASEVTRFSEAYFEGLARELGKECWLGVVRSSGDIIVAVIVLEGATFAHSHLMGDRRQPGHHGATNFVYHSIALDAAKRGLSVLHMGGGRSSSEEDPLFKFKVSLSPERALFHIGMRRHDATLYEALCDEWEKRHGPGPAGHFGFYRLKAPLHDSARS